jgi:YrbI family 3-deoxy-D-manno-octulosonate 8-phosphate phosphatase
MLGFLFYVITKDGQTKELFHIGRKNKKTYPVEAIRKIELIVCDVDGVLTDGKMIYSEKGDELKNFNTKDGIAVKLLKAAGYKLAIISSGICVNIIKKRGNFLGFDQVIVTDKNKYVELMSMLDEMKLNYENVLYIGDDINDYEAMDRCGIKCCPADACKQIRDISHIVLNASGGNGCLREVADLLLGEADYGK